jgi:hypothetical protein
MNERRGVLGSLNAVCDHDRYRLARVMDDVVLHREEGLTGRGTAHQRWHQRHVVDLRHVAVSQDAGDALCPFGH